MNKRELVKIEGDLGAEALEIIRAIPGVTAVRAQPKLPGGQRPDVVVNFAGRSEALVVELKKHVNAGGAQQLLEYARRIPDAHLVVIAGETTQGARDVLEGHGIGVIDGLGNAHVELPGLLLHVEGRGRPQGKTGDRPPTRLTGKAGVVAQALLLERERAWRVSDVADAAGVSTALAHRVLTRLDTEHLVTTEGAGPKRTRRVTNPAALFDLFLEENRDRGARRYRAFRLAPNARTLGAEVAAALAGAGIAYALTGAEAATRLAPFLTAVPVVYVWVTDAVPLDDAARAADAEPVATGHNVFFQQVEGDAPLAFRRQTDKQWRVNDLRLCFDLRNEPQRGKEQAERLRQEVIGF